MRFLIAAIAVLLSVQAQAAEPVRHIGIYVTPFYEGPQEPGGTPKVSVGQTYNALLASTKREDILAARDLIVAKPELVTPMTLMVLAIRLYDTGLRDDAVFWFYAAKDRTVVMSMVLNVKTPQLAQAYEAVGSFATLAGPVINGYAFCDLARQQEARAKAAAWVEANPYQVMFMDRAPALPGDRAENHKRAIAGLKEGVAKEKAYFADAKVRDDFYATRKRNEIDSKFCWQ